MTYSKRAMLASATTPKLIYKDSGYHVTNSQTNESYFTLLPVTFSSPNNMLNNIGTDTVFQGLVNSSASAGQYTFLQNVLTVSEQKARMELYNGANTTIYCRLYESVARDQGDDLTPLGFESDLSNNPGLLQTGFNDSELGSQRNPNMSLYDNQLWCQRFKIVKDTRFVIKPGTQHILNLSEPTQKFFNFDKLYHTKFGNYTPANIPFTKGTRVWVVQFYGEPGIVSSGQQYAAAAYSPASLYGVYTFRAKYQILQSPAGTRRSNFAVPTPVNLPVVHVNEFTEQVIPYRQALFGSESVNVLVTNPPSVPVPVMVENPTTKPVPTNEQP